MKGGKHMEQRGYSDMIFKVLDFLSGFWIIYWLIIVISAVSYDPQLFFYMIFSFLIYTSPAIIYLSFRKRIRERFRLRLAKFQNPSDALQQEEEKEYTVQDKHTGGTEEGEYVMGYREVKSDDSPISLTPKLKLLLTLIAIFLAILAAWMILSR